MAERWEREELLAKRITQLLIGLCGEDRVQPGLRHVHFQCEDKSQGWCVDVISPSQLRLRGPGLANSQTFGNLKELMTHLREEFSKTGASYDQRTDLPTDSTS